MPRNRKDSKAEAIPVSFTVSDELANRGRRLIDADGALRPLREHAIAYVLVEHRKAPEGGNVDRYVQARKAPPLWSGLTDHEATIAVNAEKWSQLSEPERDQAMLHGLCHLSVDDKGRLVTQDHDFSGFGREVRKGGAWTPELTVVVEALSIWQGSAGGNTGNAGGDDEEDLRPKGEVNADALRGEAERSIVDDAPTPIKRPRPDSRPSTPAN